MRLGRAKAALAKISVKKSWFTLYNGKMKSSPIPACPLMAAP
jgi:hypothetical protein